MIPNNINPNVLMQQLNQLRQQYKGDPMQHIQKMMQSGQVTQQQYNTAVQQAQNIMRMLGVR